MCCGQLGLRKPELPGNPGGGAARADAAALVNLPRAAETKVVSIGYYFSEGWLSFFAALLSVA